MKKQQHLTTCTPSHKYQINSWLSLQYARNSFLEALTFYNLVRMSTITRICQNMQEKKKGLLTGKGGGGTYPC